MPILLYIVMWSCALGMTSCLGAPPLEHKSNSPRSPHAEN